MKMTVFIEIIFALMVFCEVKGQVYQLPESREVCQNRESALLKVILNSI